MKVKGQKVIHFPIITWLLSGGIQPLNPHCLLKAYSPSLLMPPLLLQYIYLILYEDKVR